MFQRGNIIVTDLELDTINIQYPASQRTISSILFRAHTSLLDFTWKLIWQKFEIEVLGSAPLVLILLTCLAGAPERMLDFI